MSGAGHVVGFLRKVMRHIILHVSFTIFVSIVHDESVVHQIKSVDVGVIGRISVRRIVFAKQVVPLVVGFACENLREVVEKFVAFRPSHLRRDFVEDLGAIKQPFSSL